MNFKVLVKTLSFIGWLTDLFNGHDYGYIGDCKEITTNILPDKERYCEENQDGKVIELSLYSFYELGEENVNKIMTYDTIEKLYIGDDPKNATGIPTTIGNLKNLKELSISIESFNKNDTSNLPTSIESLSLINMKPLTQDDINGFERLTNLEKLTFTDYSIGEELDLKPFEKLEKLKKLDIFNGFYGEDKYSSFKYLEHFKNVEQLIIEKSNFTRSELDFIMKLPNLKELSNRFVEY